MIPKPNVLEDMDVETSQVARGNAVLSVEPPVPVTYGQDLVQLNLNEIAVAETPEKTKLKKQVSDLVEALNYEEKLSTRRSTSSSWMLALR